MLDETNIPKHIAFIMDGNGRWAKEKGLPRYAGHRVGAARVKEIVKKAFDLKVNVVTFFAFSTENWQRPKKEIEILMRYFCSYLDHQIKVLHKKNIKFLVIGRKNPIPKYLQDRIKKSEDLTKNNTAMTMVLALNYGSRQEIADAVTNISSLIVSGNLSKEDINEDLISKNLYTAGLPDPDLLVRTSGEMRISNFLLWQLSYAELYFPEIYWPDFRGVELEKAIKVYQDRERRFGGIDVKKNP
ncbi:MAG: isoprenyl transferase [Candidatus Omnitrophota bacterium]